MNHWEETTVLEDTAKESGVLYEHPIDKDCYVFRSEDGLVMKFPKSILDHPKLEEILLEYSSSS